MLTRLLGDLDLAEEAVADADADAFTVAVGRWRGDGLPPNPGGWIVTTAERRAIDRLRPGRADRRGRGLHSRG